MSDLIQTSIPPRGEILAQIPSEFTRGKYRRTKSWMNSLVDGSCALFDPPGSPAAGADHCPPVVQALK
eukprot:5077945-Pyramimonas_sp.AAC.1